MIPNLINKPCLNPLTLVTLTMYHHALDLLNIKKRCCHDMVLRYARVNISECQVYGSWRSSITEGGDIARNIGRGLLFYHIGIQTVPTKFNLFKCNGLSLVKYSSSALLHNGGRMAVPAPSTPSTSRVGLGYIVELCFLISSTSPAIPIMVGCQYSFTLATIANFS